MDMQFFNRRVFPYRTIKQIKTSNIICAKPNIMTLESYINDSLSFCPIDDENWDKKLFSYNNIIKKKTNTILLKNTSMNKDVIGIIVEFLCNDQ